MKIFDCFTFYNEFEVLDIRLKLLSNYVDYFVICELSKTHTGKPKELYFDHNKEKYKDYLDKIIYISPELVPEAEGHNNWTIENYQRNCLFYGLNGRCDYDDIVMISDLDELPDPEILKNLRNVQVELVQKKGSYSRIRQKAKLFSVLGERRFFSTFILRKHRNILDVLDYSPIVLEQRLFASYMNLESSQIWYGTVIEKWKLMETPHRLRLEINRLPYVKNGGWHFTYMGGADRVRMKRDSIVEGKSESEKDIEEDIQQMIEKGKSNVIQGDGNFYFCKKKIEEVGLPVEISEYIKEKYPNLLL